MSAPLVVNTKDGMCWTRRTVTSSGIALYAPEKVRTCPQFVMATLAELAEHGIAGSADVLPAPVGPQPWSQAEAKDEFERILREKFRLEDALTKARRDAARARRERDLIRERVSEPYGCTHCGHAKRSHGRQYLSGVGMHAWERPTDEQVKDRMLARRAARMPMDVEELRARVAELEAERHTTNEALDDAVRELRTSYAERARRETHPGRRQAWRMLAQCEESERVANALCTPEAERSADKLTQLLAPTQALQREGEHYASVHHNYRVGRDLPETGGAR